jgi:hypothetical protein
MTWRYGKRNYPTWNTELKWDKSGQSTGELRIILGDLAKYT